jgi:crossover junction endonuclease MUS81
MNEIIVDNRETKIKEYFTSILGEYNVTYENLDVGDIIIKRQGEIFLVIERKSVVDMAHSIRDGRWREQRIRMLQNYGDKTMYIIEGVIDEKLDDINNVAHTTLRSSIINLLIRDNIRVYFTRDIQDTITTIQIMYKKLDEIETSRSTNNVYLNNVKVKKGDNIDPEKCYILQLTHIPGVSMNIAKEIAKIYPRMKHLINIYTTHSHDIDYCNNLLSKIKHGTSQKNIGPKLSQKIFNYIYV